MSEAIICKYNQLGYCKFKASCKKIHNYEVCQEKCNCGNESCSKRHPKDCKNLARSGKCRFGDDCSYNHEATNNVKEQIQINQVVANIIKKHEYEMHTMREDIHQLKKVITNMEEKNKPVIIIPSSPTNTEKEIQIVKEVSLNIGDTAKTAEGEIARTDDLYFYCIVCSHICKTEKTLANHMNKKHKQIKLCDNCPEIFTTLEELQSHKQSVHRDGVNVKKTVTKYGQDCELCEFKYKSDVNMISHMIQEHKFKKCYKCNTTCSDRDTMETHMKEDHTDPSCETELDISLDEERLALLQIEMEKEGVQ